MDTSLSRQGPHVSRHSPVVVLAASLIGISFAAPLVRLSNSAPIVIAAWRLGLSLLIVAVALLATGSWREWRLLSRREMLLATAAGVLLALHFWSWNASLRYTSVAASVALVNLQPVLIAGVSGIWLREAPSRLQWLGVLIAVVGALLVAAADVPGGLSGLAAAARSGNGGRALFGDMLALVGAVTAAMYYLIGRLLRRRIGVWPYVALAYGSAFVTCVLLAVASAESLVPQSPRELAIFTGLAIGPMLFGHTGMNWALGHLPAFVVNLTTLGEPIGATVLAALLPGIAEVPGRATLIGGGVVLTGILLASRRPRLAHRG
jgi:drug/metabolite transporter (DMT)-like permease